MEERKSETVSPPDKLPKKKILPKTKDLTVQQQKWKKDFEQDQTITAGVEDQVDEVLKRVREEFDDLKGPRMATFQKVWKETSFGLIFHGRESLRELYEFTEDMFDIVKQFAFKSRKNEDNPDGIRYAALYLLYALYFKQPCRPIVKIKLTLEEFDEIKDFMEETRDDDHYDVLFAWMKLISEAAFHYVAAFGQLGLELAYQLEQKEIRAKEKIRRKTNFFSTGEFQRLMQKVTKSHEEYQNMKKELAEENPDGPEIFCGTDSNLPATLLRIVESSTGNKNQKQKDDIGRKRQELKHKFFGAEPIQSHRDRLFDGRKKSDNGASIKTEEIHNQFEDMELEDDKEVEVDNIPFQENPRSKLQRGMVRKRGRPRGSGAVFIPFLENVEPGEQGDDELENNSGDVDGNLRGRGARRERGKHGRKHQIGEEYSMTAPVDRRTKAYWQANRGRGARGRGARGRGNWRKKTNEVVEGDIDQNCNWENMEDPENNEMMVVEGSSAGAGPSGVIKRERARGRGRGRGAKNRRRLADESMGASGAMAGKIDDVGNVEEQGDEGAVGGQVGDKMEKAKVKRKNKEEMWGNAASRNLHYEEQLEQEPVFRFNNNSGTQ